MVLSCRCLEIRYSCSSIPSYLIITRKGGQEKQFIESSLPLSRCKPPSSCLTVMAFLAATFSKSAQTPLSHHLLDKFKTT